MTTEAALNAENFALGSGGDEDVVCPTCDVKIKRGLVAEHCKIEMERLHSMQLRSNNSAAATSTLVETTTITQSSEGGGDDGGSRRKPWCVFQRIQRNRQARQRQRTRKRPTTPTAPSAASTASKSTEPTCPVCNKNFPQSEIQRHVNQCLRSSRRNGVTNGQRHSSDDDEDSDEYEEYEWAGQKRVRVSTLVQGGYSSLNLGQTIKYNGSQQATNDEDDEDLNVDEDDTHIYGPTQYGEEDVISLTNEDTDGDVSEADVTRYVRQLLSSNEISKTNHSNGANNVHPTTEAMEDSDCHSPTPSTSQAPSTSRSSKSAQTQQQIIESLKAKLRLYEKQAQSKFKCLICIDDYKNPAISVSCWHVHCEQCWLQTLGARKLCPQCNSITTPKDLRRIYL